MNNYHALTSLIRVVVICLLLCSTVVGGGSVVPRQQNEASNIERGLSSSAVVRLKATLKGHTKSISAFLFSPDGETLATVAGDRTVKLWEARTGELKRTLDIDEKYDFAELLWSRDGRRLAASIMRTGKEYGKTYVWDTQTGQLKSAFVAHQTLYTALWSPDGKTLLTSGGDGSVRLWDAETGSLKTTFQQEPPRLKETDSVFGILLTKKRFFNESTAHGFFDATGKIVLTTSPHVEPKLWDAVTGRLLTTLRLSTKLPSIKEPNYEILYPMFSPDKSLIVRKGERGVALLDTTTGQVKYDLGHIGEVLAFSRDGRTILALKRRDEVGTRYGSVEELSLRDAATGERRLVFEKVPQVADVYWSPDGGTIIVNGEADTNPRILDAHTGLVKARLPYDGCSPDTIFGSSGCESFTFSADGRVLVKHKETVKLWSTNNGELLATLDAARLPAVFSPTDARLLVTRSKDKKSLLLWEVVVK